MINRKELEKEIAQELRDLELEGMKINMHFEDRLRNLIKSSMLKKRDLNLASVKSTYYLAVVQAKHNKITDISVEDERVIQKEVDNVPMEKLQETITQILDQFQHAFKPATYSQFQFQNNVYKYSNDFKLSVKLT